MDFSARQLGFLTCEELTHLRQCRFKVRQSRRLHPHGLARTIAEADTDDAATRRVFLQRGISARDYGRMARQRIGYTSPEFNSARVNRYGGHVDVGFSPDQMRVAHPYMCIPQIFRDLG